MSDRILDAAISFIPPLMPDYHPDAADIHEALDSGVASCAARSYAAALLLRHSYPNESLYSIDFGYSPEHGDDFVGTNGSYIKMGHAVTRFWIPEKEPIIFETFDDASIELVRPNDSHQNFIWETFTQGYTDYLKKADLDNILDDKEILACMFKRLKLYSRKSSKVVQLP